MATRVTSTRLVGRDSELAELIAAVDDAAAGRPSLAFVAGESGVGKTRLLSELSHAASSGGARVLTGECVELGEGELPYAPIVAALRPLLRSGDPVLGALSPAARATLEQVLPGAGGAALPRERHEDVGADRARLFEALLELLERLGEDGALVLIIEDLHWADRSTRGFLAYLAASLDSEHVLAVVSYRPDELHRRHPLRPLLAELERDPRARRLDLRPLTREQLAAQLADILGAPPPEDMLERLWARSEGNPLFAEELLAAGLDGRGSLPPTLREAFMLRIERLPADSQELLRLLAVGQRLDHALLADAAGLDARTLREALREAVAAQILIVDPEGRYAFRHALLREAVDDDLLPGERAELHLRLARALEARVAAEPDGPGAHLAAGIAHHYSAAADQPAALAAAVRAGSAAEDVHAYGEAASLYERALALWDRVPDAERLAGQSRVSLLRAAAWCHATEHDPGRAETLLRSALTYVDAESDPHTAATVLERIARQQWHLGRGREAQETRRQALALLPEGEDSEVRATILASTAKELMLASRYRESVDTAREAIAVARAVGEQLPEVRALDALGVALAALGDPEAGFAALREAIEIAERSQLPITSFVSYTNLGDSLYQAGRLAEAREVTERGRQRGAAIGRTSRWLDLQAAELAIEAGDWAAGEALLPPAGRRTMGTTFLNEALRRIELQLGRGEHAAARALLEEAEAVGADIREPQFIGPAAVLRAELERRTGDLDAARAAIDDGLDRIEFCSEDVARISRVASSGVAVEADAAVRARDLADPDAEAEALGRVDGLLARAEATAGENRPVESAHLLTARAHAARARGQDDPALWAAAAEAWAALERPYRAACARRRQAEAHVAAAERDAAARVASEALASARAIGATWLASELEGFAARARLRLDATASTAPEAAGATHEAGDGDPFGLTPRERQVLELVAGGRTNREIGQALFMAEKTASVHVSRILAKLDVRTRTEAAAVAHRLGLLG